MVDIRRTGHPRTLGTHREMQMRDVQRAGAKNNKPIVDRNGLHVGMVVNVDKHGNVQVDNFTDDLTGVGQWFSCLNHTSPRAGDKVIYGYVDDAPFVLGKMPDDSTAGKIPEVHMEDTFFFDDFEFGTANDMGILTWQGITSGGGVSMSNGTIDTPGAIVLSTGTTVGTYSYTHPKFSLAAFFAANLYQVGFGGFSPNVSSLCQWVVGLTDNGVAPANYILFVSNGTDGNWGVAYKEGASTATPNLGVPYVDNHYYRFLLQRTDTGGTWLASIYDITAGIAGSVLLPFTYAGSLVPYSRNYMLTASTSRTAYLDYCWWSRRNLKR
jgi:hypothetical protein